MIVSKWVHVVNVEMTRMRNDLPCMYTMKERGEEFIDRLHECGHALVSLLTPGAMPIDKITIIPRGDVSE